MLAVPVTAHRLAQATLRVTAVQVAWGCAIVGSLATMATMQLRMWDLVPVGALATGFALFHLGALAALWGLVRGPRQGALSAFLYNGLPAATAWLAALSLQAFAARWG